MYSCTPSKQKDLKEHGYSRIKIYVSYKSISIFQKHFWLIHRYWHFLSRYFLAIIWLFQSFWEKSKHSCVVLASHPKRIASYSICFIENKLITYKCTQLYLFYSKTASELVKNFIEGNILSIFAEIKKYCYFQKRKSRINRRMSAMYAIFHFRCQKRPVLRLFNHIGEHGRPFRFLPLFEWKIIWKKHLREVIQKSQYDI